MNDTNSENILGYQVAATSIADCLSLIAASIDGEPQGKYFACANPHSLEVARHDPLFSRALKQADLLVPDGVGIILASRLLGGTIRERITGSDIFHGVCTLLDSRPGSSVFFLGSSEETLSLIEDRMRIDFPHITVAGTYSPPFRAEFSPEDNRRMLTAINRAKPDVVWVGLTAPKQEKWIYQHRDQIQVKFIGAIGAVFDFYAGNIKRSPPVFQRLGLEWLPRLLQEPRRLWRRNVISNPGFMLRVLRARFFG